MGLLESGVVAGLLVGCEYALVGVGLTLIFGTMELVNFAQGDLVMVAMYLVFFLWSGAHFDPLLSLPIAAVAGIAIGILTYEGLIRPLTGKPVIAQMVVTLGASAALEGGAQLWLGPNTEGIPNTVVSGFRLTAGAVTVTAPEAIAAFGAVVCIALVSYLVHHTRMGASLQAVAQDPYAAQLVGIRPRRVFMLAWGISGITIGVAGALFMQTYAVDPTVGITFAIFGFVVVILGGFGSIWGAFFASLIMGVAESLGTTYLSEYGLAVAFAVFLVILVVRPMGLRGTS